MSYFAGSCAKKHRYASKRAAQEELDRLRRGGKPWALELHAYPCPWCLGGHLGNKYRGGRRMPRAVW